MIKNKNMYDIKAKQLLSNKRVITNLLQNVVTEYQGLSFDEVFYLIEDGSESQIINGINTEDVDFGDKEIRYDILFTAKLPKSKDKIGLYVNIEPQSYYTPYPITKRAIYYASRLISRQKGIEFNGQDYKKLKKVYSIWIVIPKDIDQYNTVKRFRLMDEDIIGKYSIDKSDYDLMDITIFNLGDNPELNTNALSMLKLFFIDMKLSSKEISERLYRDYNIIYSEQEVEDMATLSRGIENLGYQKGIEQGKFETFVKSVKSLIKLGYSVEQACKILEIDEVLTKTIIEELNK